MTAPSGSRSVQSSVRPSIATNAIHAPSSGSITPSQPPTASGSAYVSVRGRSATARAMSGGASSSVRACPMCEVLAHQPFTFSKALAVFAMRASFVAASPPSISISSSFGTCVGSARPPASSEPVLTSAFTTASSRSTATRSPGESPNCLLAFPSVSWRARTTSRSGDPSSPWSHVFAHALQNQACPRPSAQMNSNSGGDSQSPASSSPMQRDTGGSRFAIFRTLPARFSIAGDVADAAADLMVCVTVVGSMFMRPARKETCTGVTPPKHHEGACSRNARTASSSERKPSITFGSSKVPSSRTCEITKATGASLSGPTYASISSPSTETVCGKKP